MLIRQYYSRITVIYYFSYMPSILKRKSLNNNAFLFNLCITENNCRIFNKSRIIFLKKKINEML